MNKISIITINYNNHIGLQRTFESVFNQIEADFDYIIVDGGSTDGSANLIEKHQHQFTKWISEKDHGIYNAMNKGLSFCKTDYVLFLNSGDFFYSNKVIAHYQEIINSNSYDLVYGNLNVLDSKAYIKTYPEKLTFRYFLYDTLPFPATLIKKKLIEKVGYFDENLKIVSDWKFFLQLFTSQKISYYYAPETMVSFDLDGISSTATELLKEEKNKVLNEDFAFVYHDIQQGIVMEQKMKYLVYSRLFKFLKKYNLLKFLK